MLIVCMYNAMFIRKLEDPVGICYYMFGFLGFCFLFFLNKTTFPLEFIGRSQNDTLRGITTVFCTC